MDITFAALVTPAGVVIAAGLVTGFVGLVKRSFAVLDARFSGATMAFAVSAGLYVATALALAPVNADGYLGVAAAWLACATSAVGIRETVVHARGA